MASKRSSSQASGISGPMFFFLYWFWLGFRLSSNTDPDRRKTGMHVTSATRELFQCAVMAGQQEDHPDSRVYVLATFALLL